MVTNIVKTKLIFLVLFIFIFKLNVNAGILLGVSKNSWQEKIPIIVANVEEDKMTTFTGLGLHLGYDYTMTQRTRYNITASYVGGFADIHKLAGATAPRKNFYALWLQNKVMWRSTKTFAVGPNFVVNNRKLDELSAAISAGLFFDFDYDLFKEMRLTQSVGTMSDSSQLAYHFVFSYIF